MAPAFLAMNIAARQERKLVFLLPILLATYLLTNAIGLFAGMELEAIFKTYVAQAQTHPTLSKNGQISGIYLFSLSTFL